ncbi:MAG: DUF6079 family protein [Candidatus Methanoperedens sp.]|nr:DUF6079 family protein [Candidatus Methanoperedens sp.]
MKYSDLVEFEPITTVIQIKEANKKDRAKELVRTFVISKNMEENITKLLIPNIQFHEVKDNKGVLVVGNYGTGKSHLMSVISAIAEDSDMLQYLSNKSLAEKLGSISGKFKVIRTEIGGVRMSLRDIVLKTLEKNLSEIGINYAFPAADKVTNNKDSLMEMMGLFNQKFPDQGYLLVIDELLDYLLSRKDQELVLDLNFLREIGEVCKNTRFRTIAGIQESLFDNPRFQFIAQTLLKVKDRYEQFYIVREDVAFVVSQRLLMKNKNQKAMIREHLERFSPLYPIIGKRINEFIELFPIHPIYLETFEKIYVAEKREILKTISREIESILDMDVPEDYPGLITYDTYWKRLKENPSIRTIPDVKKVIDTSSVLEDRIRQSFPKAQYKETALKLIHGLSIHRLTTGDFKAKLGATTEELRDSLCPYIPGLPEPDAEFLKTSIEAILKDMQVTVGHQFINHNKENGQFYIDLDKVVDYEGKIEERAKNLDDNVLDRNYFNALKKVMEYSDVTYVTGYNIWEHEVEWKERKVTRQGYLFFGAPNERSTAQPPRDFYIYFIQPYDAPKYEDEKKPDEVFFHLHERDEIFEDSLRKYSAARELASLGGDSRTKYEEKANEYIKQLAPWLKEHITTAFNVTYKGVTKKAVEWSRGRSGDNVRDIVNNIASVCLGLYFKDIRPDYPAFTNVVTNENRGKNAQEAVRYISGNKTQMGRIFCDNLGLLDGDNISPTNSIYAQYIIELLKTKGQGQVINRKELFEGGEGVEYDIRFKIEPEWMAVVLVSLIHSGHIALSLPGKKIDASNIEDLLKVKIEDLTNFKHIEPPKDLPLKDLIALSKLLGLTEGQIKNDLMRDAWVTSLQTKVSDHLNHVVTTAQHLKEGFVFCGESVLKTKEDEYRRTLDSFKAFLEGLQVYNTPGKLKNFKYNQKEIETKKKGLELLKSLEGLMKIIQDTAQISSYMQAAIAMLPTDHEWYNKLNEGRKDAISMLSDEKAWDDASISHSLKTSLNALKKDYIAFYLDLHKKSRLGITDDKKKAKLLKDNRLKQLSMLTNISFMNRSQLTEFQNKLAGLKSCFEATDAELNLEPRCSHCNFIPNQETKIYGPNILDDLEEELNKLHGDWTKALLDNLSDPTVKKNLELLSTEHLKLLGDFMDKKVLPKEINNDFIQAVQEVLQGLVKVETSIDEIKHALLKGGVPCTSEELSKRFETFLEELTYGKDKKKVRIVLE